jgi:hypothetical protein
MDNKEVKLKMLEADIKSLGELLKDAALTIFNEGVSNYPIFVAHRYALNMGIELVDKERMQTNWSFNASTLEEMVTKNIISRENLDGFREIYKSPEDFVCIFVIDETISEFVFYPYEEEVSGDAVSDAIVV